MNGTNMKGTNMVEELIKLFEKVCPAADTKLKEVNGWPEGPAKKEALEILCQDLPKLFSKKINNEELLKFGIDVAKLILMSTK